MIVIYKPENCFPQQAPGSRVGFDRLELRSGMNPLSEAEFARLQAHPDFPGYVARQALVVQEAQEEVLTVPLSDTPANLSAYNVPQADQIIDHTHDVDVLKRWLGSETRKTTRDALTRRIKDLGGNV